MAEDSQRSGTTGPGARGRGRELALSVMCALESHAESDESGRAAARALVLDRPPRGDDEGEGAFFELAASEPGRTFAEALLEAWTERRAEVDALIEQVSRRWRLDRMDHVDRNVLRLAGTELSAMPATPRAVVLAEAVRLARRYGSDKSAPFVNGVVESLAQQLRPTDGGSD